MEESLREYGLLVYAAWGFAGALVGSMSRNRRLELPRLTVERRCRKADGEGWETAHDRSGVPSNSVLPRPYAG